MGQLASCNTCTVAFFLWEGPRVELLESALQLHFGRRDAARDTRGGRDHLPWLAAPVPRGAAYHEAGEALRGGRPEQGVAARGEEGGGHGHGAQPQPRGLAHAHHPHGERCLPEGQQLSRATSVIAELQLEQNMHVARQLSSAGGVGSAGGLFGFAGLRAAGRGRREHSAVISLVPLCASRAVDLLAVLCATAPAAGRVLQELMRTQGSEIYSVPVHGQLVGGSLAAAARGAPFALSSASCANTTPARRSHPSDT